MKLIFKLKLKMILKVKLKLKLTFKLKLKLKMILKLKLKLKLNLKLKLKGAIQGPGEFATGLAYGMRSLFGHTVGGAAGAVSKITGAMAFLECILTLFPGKGLAALTFDKEYQKDRLEMYSHQPANLQEGLAQSGKGLVMVSTKSFAV
ncbi:unnamed protein product [Nesidiocoris tenuis]|uniref:Uncharacterized protein n=1 Tax=Nesidiocoris tenuis TaxID=355587 RepID=A0A6H5H726_9HEMI|nr:unnamed protein product [Nesidiocoris tenuis]